MAETRFTNDHEWVRLADGVVTVGITAHAQEALGDVVYVDLPAAGRSVEAGEACAVVESVKAASDVYAPLKGTVTDRNDGLSDDPALVNRAPEQEGWFFKLRLADAAAFEGLMDEAAYRAFVESLA
ncbi:MAG: glycine cleavage system protein GcvH [Acetobacteraceae bacterium]|nr:glycine cleavage system protein GcvH [Acetobacteraceae bacterium]